MSLTYALIGCGRIATNHLQAVFNNEIELVAVCDVNQEKMERLLAKHGLSEGLSIDRFSDYREMLIQHPEIELVAIATESGEHARIALDCLRLDKNLIIEKPIALSIRDAEEIVRLARERGLKVSACHQNRFNLAVQHTWDAIKEGRLGCMSHGSIHVRWNRGESYYRQASWRGSWDQDGGCLMNQCIHGIDLLRWLMGGEVVSVFAQTRQRFHGYLEAEDVGVAILTFRDGSIATVEGTTNVYPCNLEETLYLFGETGTVKIGGTSTNNIEVWDFKSESVDDLKIKVLQEPTSNVYGNGHTLLYADVVDAIKNNRSPHVDARAGRDALEVVLAIYKSQKTGCPVTLPLEDFSSIDMKGEFENA